MHSSLGKTFRCRITGFTGVATARVEYLTGCNQLHLQPPVKADGTFVDGAYLDEQRLEEQADPAVKLDNGKNPGFGAAPPRG